MGLRRTRPATVPTDRIIPLRHLDGPQHLRDIVHDFTLRFDDVLNPSKLEAALERLMEIGDWGQLGARLRENNRSKGIEYHVPAQYSQSRPAFIFTTKEYGIGINEHPLGARLPRAGHDQAQSSLFPSSAEFAPLVRHPDSPQEIADWLYSDRPQLHVHIVLFTDATLLTITYPHTLLDGIARKNLASAWIAVLRGEEEKVPPFVPFDHDPLSTLGLGEEAHPQNYIHFNQLVRGFSLLVFFLRYLFNLPWFQTEVEYTVRLPGQWVSKMQQTVQQELAAAATNPDPNTPSPSPPRLSGSDIVLAWWIQTMISTSPPAADRTITLVNAFNIWSLFPEHLPNDGTGYIGNAFFLSHTPLAANRIHQDTPTTLSYIASTTRQSLLAHRTREQVHATAAIQRSSFLGIGPLVGDMGMLLLGCSNQHMARFFDWDFSAAVVRPGVSVTQRPNGLGRASYVNDIRHSRGHAGWNIARIMGRDGAGDWWLGFKAREGVWPVIQRRLVALAWYEGEASIETGTGEKGGD